jgi:Fic family protein
MNDGKKEIKYAEPKLLPKDGIKLDANIFMKEKSEAEYTLGLLRGSGGEGHGKRFFNPQLLISPLLTKEAVMSSKIEGTISTVSDVYKYEAGEKTHHSGTAEVYNYRKAMRQAVELVQSGKKMNKSHIKDIQKTLLTDVRHKGHLGEFRKEAVWIGEHQNDPIEKAIYVPPFYSAVESYMDNLFEYIEHGIDDPLTKVALAHYQFEAIHPFCDGNGRVGRWLIPLILFENKKINHPILYMSGYFDLHRDEYRQALHGVDTSQEYEKWLKFFFNSVVSQAKETLAIITKINELHEKIKIEIGTSKSPYLLPFLAYMFESPVFHSSAVMKKLKTTYPPISNIIKILTKKKIISLIPNPDKRKKVYAFNPLIELLTNL